VLRRVIDLIANAARHAVPVGGIFALGWQPPVALAVYWIESVLLVAIAALLCIRLRDTPGTPPDGALTSDLNPRDVLLFHWGSMAFFGLFFAIILLGLAANGRIAPIDWHELRDAAGGMVLVVVLGFGIDTLLLPAPSVAAVQARVNACLGRWALLWLLGFGGAIAMAFTGRPETFFQAFALLKLTWEGWGLLARTFGWQSLNDRAQAGRAAR
jgi:hypothetical protein